MCPTCSASHGGGFGREGQTQDFHIFHKKISTCTFAALMHFPSAKQNKNNYSHRASWEILQALCLALFGFWQSRVEGTDCKVQRPEEVREEPFFTRNPCRVWKLIFPVSSASSAPSLPRLQAQVQ